MSAREFPSGGELKRQAKRALRPCLRTAAIVTAAQVACILFRYYNGGTLNYYMLDAAQYAASRTGIWLAEGGLSVIVRLDALGLILGIPLSTQSIVTFLLVNLVCFLLTAPLGFAALEQFDAILDGTPRTPHVLTHWYTNLRHTLRALALGAILGAVNWGLRLALSAPGWLLAYRAFSGSAGDARFDLYALGGDALWILGMLAAYYVYLLLFPARYVLARDPQMSLCAALREGVRLGRGLRGRFFRFRLSFVGWFLLVQLSWCTANLLVLPYSELATMLFLRAATGMRAAAVEQEALPGATP